MSTAAGLELQKMATIVQTRKSEEIVRDDESVVRDDNNLVFPGCHYSPPITLAQVLVMVLHI